MKKTDIAWAAGLFEGEGYVGPRKSGSKNVPRWYPAASISTTDKDIMDRWMSVVRCGHVKLRTNKSSPGSKPQYCWQLTRVADFEKFQRWMLPWMGKRRAKQFQKAWGAYKANPPKTRE